MNRIERTIRCLHGIAIGESLGLAASRLSVDDLLFRRLPRAPWSCGANTQMAMSVVEVLRSHDQIDSQALAALFAKRYETGANRGYTGDVRDVLESIVSGVRWEDAALNVDIGAGSRDDGAAVRAVPIGAFFAGFPARAADEARRSARITHMHVEGQAGGIASAVAAALRYGGDRASGAELLQEIVRYVPNGQTRRALGDAAAIPVDELITAFAHLAPASSNAASTTVPISLWIAAHYGDDFTDSVWKMIAGGVALETTCALVAGLSTAGLARIPPVYRERSEALPPELSLESLA